MTILFVAAVAALALAVLQGQLVPLTAFMLMALASAAVTYDLTPLITALAPYVAYALAAVLVWLALRVAKALHITIEAGQRAALEGALAQGIQHMIKFLPTSATLPEKIAHVAAYVEPKVPGAIKGLTGGNPEHLADMIRARLPA